MKKFKSVESGRVTTLRWALALVLVVVLCVALFFGVACSKTNKEAQGEASYFNKVNPKGADPMKGSGNTDNVNYMAYVLEQQDEWYAVSDSQAKAAGGINNQQIWTDKYYKDGYMLTTQKSHSSFSKEAFEALFVSHAKDENGKDLERGVYLRTGSKPKNKDHNFDDVEWGTSEEDVEYLLEQSYYFLHGLFSDEISVFVINDASVVEAGSVTKNSDGTYTQSFTLDTSNSVYYYQYSMRNHGNLNGFPAFEYVTAEFTFDKDFHILKLYTTEKSTVMNGIKNTTTATTTYTYPWDEGYEQIWADAADTLTEAQSYFDQYFEKLAPSDNVYSYTPSATDVLMASIDDLLSADGGYYDMTLTYEEMVVNGYLYGAVNLDDLDIDAFLDADYSNFSISMLLDLIVSLQNVYDNVDLSIAVLGEDGDPAMLLQLLKGNGLLDVLDIYLANGIVADTVGIASLVENKTLTALSEIMNYDEREATDGMVLDFPANGRGTATVSYVSSGFVMDIVCEVSPVISEETTEYAYVLDYIYMEIPSINMTIVLKPTSEDDLAAAEKALDPDTYEANFGFETLLSDILFSLADISLDGFGLVDTFTFSGNIDVSLSGYGITIDNLVVTLGNVYSDFYVSFVGDLGGGLISTASTIGLTYYDGWIVMARNLETETPTYRAMSAANFVEYMLDSDANVSPIAWLLGTNSIMWAIVSAFFPSGESVASVVENDEIYDEGSSYINISDYISGVDIALGGTRLADIGEFSAEETFGLEDNYWAFNINSDWISSITSGIVTDASLAITHSDETSMDSALANIIGAFGVDVGSIGGIYVVGSLWGFLDISLNLKYEMGLDAAYDLTGGNLQLAITEEREILGEDGETATETVVTGINAQIVPNLYTVFVEMMATCGIDESELFADLTTEATLTTSVSSFTGTTTVTATGEFVFCEYTVGENSYTAYYYHEEATGTRTSTTGSTTQVTVAAGLGWITVELGEGDASSS